MKRRNFFALLFAPVLARFAPKPSFIGPAYVLWDRKSTPSGGHRVELTWDGAPIEPHG